LTVLTLLVATFDTLDVVVDAPLLDHLDTATSAEGRARRAAVEAKTEALLNSIVAPVMAVVGQAQLRMVTGMLGLLMDRNDLSRVLRSKPGLAFLTILLSRAESLKQQQQPAAGAAAAAAPGTGAPEPAELEQWHRTFTHLFGVLQQQLGALFPSSRLAASLPFGVAQYQSLDALRPECDLDDEPVWRFLAAVAVCADPDQQQVLVTAVRDKVIEGVRAARQGAKARGAQAVAPEKAAFKIVRRRPPPSLLRARADSPPTLCAAQRQPAPARLVARRVHDRDGRRVARSSPLPPLLSTLVLLFVPVPVFSLSLSFIISLELDQTSTATKVPPSLVRARASP